MSELFKEVKEPLKRSSLIPFTKEKWENEKSDLTYEELVEGLESYGLSVKHIYESPKGLFPYWFVKDFLFIPLSRLDNRHFKLPYTKEKINYEVDRLRGLFDSQKYEDFFTLLTSQFTFDVFFSEMEQIPKEKRYKLFRSLYVRNDYGFQDIEQEKLYELFSLQEERTFKKNLPVDDEGYVTIYRGMQEKSAPAERAYSWTISKAVAMRFAMRFDSLDCTMYQAKIHIRDVVDYVQSRSEEEILLFPDKLVEIKNLGYYNINQSLMNELGDYGIISLYQEYSFQRLKGTWFHKPDGIHGKRHIKRVLLLSLIMSHLDELSEEDRNVLILASLYHDIGREHDHEDEAHGMQSVLKMEKLKLSTYGLSNEDVRILKFIMKYHCIRDEVGLKKIEKQKGIQNKERAIELFRRFKDCDGLDRVRLGDLDPRYLRTETAKKMVFVAKQLLQNIE